MKHTVKELEENYDRFITTLKKVFSGDRLKKLLHMYSMDELGSNLLLSPASLRKNWHNAYEGGYMDHIMNVVNNSMRVLKLYKEIGGFINFTEEELLMSAFHHDLGKLGEKGILYYIPNPSDWHVKTLGATYTLNPELSFMTHTDRTFLLLSKYNIKLTENEYFGIKLADGLYDEDNTKYLKTFNADNALKSNIGHIMHFADHMSALVERDAIR